MLLIAALMTVGVSFVTTDNAAAAAARGMPIANALAQSDATRAEPVACRRARVCRAGYGCVWRRTCW
jgi:hypothetical protein